MVRVILIKPNNYDITNFKQTSKKNFNLDVNEYNLLKLKANYIDLDYISKIQPRLQQFKKKRDYLYNFRCPVCGDSKKSKTKARAYLYRVKSDMFFKCHNCG